MPSTPTYGLRYPASSNVPDVPTDMGNLALDVEGAFKELAFAERTTDQSVAATSEATANTVLTAPAVTLTVATPVLIEFFAPAASPGGTGLVILWLYEGAGSIGAMGTFAGGTAGNVFQVPHIARRLAAGAGSHTWSIRASVSAGGPGIISAGPGGAGQNVPAFIRVTKA